MRTKFRLYLILGLAINTLAFSGSTLAAAYSWNAFNIKLDGIGCGVDRGVNNASGGANKRLFCSIGTGYTKAKPYNPKLTYQAINHYSFGINGTKVTNGTKYNFSTIKYGDNTNNIILYKDGQQVDKYQLVFTNLPVIQLSQGTLPVFNNAPKIPGKFRLMSTEFKQDTSTINMSVSIHGQTAKLFPKNGYNIRCETGVE